MARTRLPRERSGGPSLPVVYGREVAAARAVGAPIVALETAVLSLGLPYPQNEEVFEAMQQAVRSSGAVPASIAIADGRVVIGLSASIVHRFAAKPGVEKAARRDLGRILATGGAGATTVSSTIWLAQHAAIPVAATGGIGGVHFAGDAGAASLDVSADLPTLAGSSVLLVSSGVKSICDAVATGELLETLSVPVVGFRTARFPHFYGGPSPLPVPSVRTAAEAARVFVMHRATGSRSAVLVANPAPREHRIDPELLDRLTHEGMAAAARERVRGQGLTPFLLAFLARATDGRSVRANRELLVANARLAGQIAVAMARLG